MTLRGLLRHRLSTWARRRRQEVEEANDGVFKRPECLFRYCPHPAQCLSLCRNEARADGEKQDG